MCAPSPPPAPDYTKAAQQQGQNNIETAKVQGQLNNPNVVSPYGTQNVTYGTGFDEAGYSAAQQAWKDAEARHVAKYGIPIPTTAYREGFQPPSRDQFTSGNPNQATVTQQLSPEQQTLYNQQVATQQKLGAVAGQGADALKGVVGTGVDFSGAPTTGSYDDTRKRVIDAMMGRASEDYTKRIDQDRSNLIAAGIRPGSKAYGDNQQMTERA